MLIPWFEKDFGVCRTETEGVIAIVLIMPDVDNTFIRCIFTGSGNNKYKTNHSKDTGLVILSFILGGLTR